MSGDEQLVGGWMAAAREVGVRAGLEAIYGEVARAVAARGPVCWASGRCCNFAKTGHRLYVTGLEAAYVLAERPGAPGKSENTRGGAISLPQVEAAKARGDCPFLEGTLCGVHEVKPLGCRVYFCDKTAQEWQRELSERMQAEIRRLHEERGVEYRYGEWRGMLGAFCRDEEKE